jgi:hypothetical protein
MKMKHEPVLRIFVTPRGVLKIDAIAGGDGDREKTYEFCHCIFTAIRKLDKDVRRFVQAASPPQVGAS